MYNGLPGSSSTVSVIMRWPTAAAAAAFCALMAANPDAVRAARTEVNGAIDCCLLGESSVHDSKIAEWCTVSRSTHK